MKICDLHHVNTAWGKFIALKEEYKVNKLPTKEARKRRAEYSHISKRNNRIIEINEIQNRGEKLDKLTARLIKTKEKK